jgi:hypothetical protein
MNPEAPKVVIDHLIAVDGCYERTCVGWLVDGDEKEAVYGDYVKVVKALQSVAEIEKERPRITISFGGFYVVPE